MEVPRTETGRIMKGFSLNPAGRPVGCVGGRTRALNIIDSVLGDEVNLKKMEAALVEALNKKPLWFFVNIVMPLLPKETKGVLESGNHVMEWRSLVTTGLGSAAGLPVPPRDPSLQSLPGDSGDAGFLHLRSALDRPVIDLPVSFGRGWAAAHVAFDDVLFHAGWKAS